MIIVKNVYKKYDDKYILKNFSYKFENGLYLISGSSGKGKTTLLNILSFFRCILRVFLVMLIL